MNILVTGSAGHLGEALVRSLKARKLGVIGLDVRPSPYTDIVGSITERGLVREAVQGCDCVLHTATLHKPHVATHSRQDFLDTNITGTLNLLEESAAGNCQSLIFTSTTSTFGDAMVPNSGEPAVWVTEELRPRPKNIYGVTKNAAEDLCELFHRNANLPCVVLKTSRFFPEPDDSKHQRSVFDDTNLKVNELLYRRIDIQDIVSAHFLALQQAQQIGFERLILTATTPFNRDDANALSTDAAAVLEKHVPAYVAEYQRRNWKMHPSLGRVYDNSKARRVLGWEPEFSFSGAIERLSKDLDYRSELARTVGVKGYHGEAYRDGLYPVSEV